MAKVLILLAVIALVWWLLRPRPGRGSQPDAVRPPPGAPREIIECAHCGVHVPRDEALPGPGGSLYCCDAHRKAGAARGDGC